MANPIYNIDDAKQWWNIPMEQRQAIMDEWATLTQAKTQIDAKLQQAKALKQMRDIWGGNYIPGRIGSALLTPSDKQIAEWENQITYIDRKMRSMVSEMPWVTNPQVKSNQWETAMRSWADSQIKAGADPAAVNRDMETALGRLYGESALPGTGSGDVSGGVDSPYGTLPETYFGMTERDWKALTPQQQAARVNDYLGIDPNDDWSKSTWQKQFDASQDQNAWERQQTDLDRATAADNTSWTRQQQSLASQMGMLSTVGGLAQGKDELAENARQFNQSLAWQKESFWASIGWDKEKFAKQLGWDQEKFEKELGWDKEKFDRELEYKREELYAQLQQRQREAAMQIGQSLMGEQSANWRASLGQTLPRGTTTPPGFEAGGPMEQLYKMGGSTSYSPLQITPSNPPTLESMLGVIGKAISQFGSTPKK